MSEESIEYNEELVDMQREKWALEKRISALESALVAIRDHEHCLDINSPNPQPDTDPKCECPLNYYQRHGHADGHRCCAEIARKALEKK